MSQYRVGTITVVNTDATVIGTGTLWTANVSVGDLFIVDGQTVSYEVGSVTDNTHIELTAPYTGANSNTTYAICRDFTPVRNIPYINPSDVSTAEIIKRALMIIDGLL